MLADVELISAIFHYQNPEEEKKERNEEYQANGNQTIQKPTNHLFA